MSADTSHPLWLWGVELFWLAITAAFPDFISNGLPPVRVADIPFDEINLAQRSHSLSWYKRYDHEPGVKFDRIRMDLWEEFQQRVTLIGFNVF